MHAFSTTREFIRKGLLIALLFIAVLSVPSLASAQTPLDIIIHHIEGAPADGKAAHQTQAYLSVMDGDGVPVEDLGASNFTVTEDNQKVDIASIEFVDDAAMNVVLLIDTSGSMRGVNIEGVRKAASDFIASLSTDDLIAVQTFNQEIVTLIESTNNHQSAAAELENIQAISGAGTCLYDAAYGAAELAAAFPPGQRVVVLLTDGVDELADGSVCSIHTRQDVIDLAASGNTRLPVYTIGLGQRSDEEGLQELSDSTGGKYLHSPDSTSLSELFKRLSRQLKSQIVINYLSKGGAGAHDLTIQVEVDGQQDSDTRSFLLPELPTTVSILQPSSGEEISGKMDIVASVSGQGEPVDKIIFEINGAVVGASSLEPYLIVHQFEQTGLQEITVRAIGENGKDISTHTIKVNVVPAPTQPPKETSVQQAEPTTAASTEGASKSRLILYGGIGLGLLILVAMLFFLMDRRRKKEQPLDSGPSAADVLATLTVLHCDDPMMIGEVLNIIQPVTSVGRSVENDIFLPKDSPISRKHITLEQDEDQILLKQVIAEQPDGTTRRPKFGTFVNDQQVGDDPVTLRNGDEIRLGARAVFRFGQDTGTEGSEDMTMDGLMIDLPAGDSDATMDGLGVEEDDHTLDDASLDIDDLSDATMDDVALEESDSTLDDADFTLDDSDLMKQDSTPAEIDSHLMPTIQLDAALDPADFPMDDSGSEEQDATIDDADFTLDDSDFTLDATVSPDEDEE